MHLKPLFGDSLPWNASDRVTWVSVDDRVRGGSSVSHLDPINSTTDGTTHRDARFWGVLDTKTLGGAGFASSTTEWADDDTSLDLSGYDGILLQIVRADDKRYTFNVKDEVPGRREDGRMRSGVSWEFDFEVSEADEGGMGKGDVVQVRIPWEGLKATYRGKDVKDPTPLKTGQIRKFSIMMRSFFEKQDGDFEMILRSISAYRSEEDEQSQAMEGHSQL